MDNKMTINKIISIETKKIIIRSIEDIIFAKPNIFDYEANEIDFSFEDSRRWCNIKFNNDHLIIETKDSQDLFDIYLIVSNIINR